MRNGILALTVFLLSGGFCLVACPSADLTGDCFVDFNDFAMIAIDWPTTDYNDVAVMANQWLTTGPCIPDDMVLIPGGPFEMGDNFDEGASYERPVHTVTVDSFYMGKYEITNRQYCDYLNSAYDACDIKVEGGIVYAFSDGSNSYPYCDTDIASVYSQIDYSGDVFSVRTDSERDMSEGPMLEVSWYGAVAYCNWRSSEQGYQDCYDLATWDCNFAGDGYRLPTEAEWEYAARGGLSGSRFPWGDTISHSEANYYSWWSGGIPRYPYDVSPTEGFHPDWADGVFPYTSPAGSFAANGYGLYDMAGNVWEWCGDWYAWNYYSNSPTDNPTGPTSDAYRILRGGCWHRLAYFCRVAHRDCFGPETSRYNFGFRIVIPE